MQTIYVNRWATSRGILAIETDSTPDSRGWIAVKVPGRWFLMSLRPGEWFTDWNAAVSDAENRRAKRLASLERTAERLRRKAWKPIVPKA